MMPTTRRAKPAGASEAPPEVRAIYDAIRADILAEIEPRLPQMATVDGKDGGRVRFSRDGEPPGSRQAGVPAPVGVQPAPGRRGWTMRDPATGEEFLGGYLTESDGGRRGVGGDEVLLDSLEGRHLRGGAVRGGTEGEIAPDTVTTRELRQRSVTPAVLDRAYASPDSVDNAAARAAEARGLATDAQRQAATAGSAAGRAQGSADRALSEAAGAARDAGEAKGTADRARTDAGDALKKANEALTLAQRALKRS